MGKFKTRIFRRKKDENDEILSSTALEGQELLTSNWTGNPWSYNFSGSISDFNHPHFQEAIDSANRENGLPQLNDDAGIVKTLQNKVIQNSIEALQGNGSMLSQETLDELGFGDLESVQIHTDSVAQLLCKILKARAFAYKNHVFFDSQEFSLKSHSGLELLSHELSHIRESNQDSLKRQVTQFGSLKKQLDEGWNPTEQDAAKIREILNELSEQDRRNFFTDYPAVYSMLQDDHNKHFYFDPKQTNEAGTISNIQELALYAPRWLEAEINTFLDDHRGSFLDSKDYGDINFWKEYVYGSLERRYDYGWGNQLAEYHTYENRKGETRTDIPARTIDHGKAMVYAVFNEIFPAYLEKVLDERTVANSLKALSNGITDESSIQSFQRYRIEYKQAKERRLIDLRDRHSANTTIKKLMDIKLRELEAKYKKIMSEDQVTLLLQKQLEIKEISEESTFLELRKLGVISPGERIVNDKYQIELLSLENLITMRMSDELDEYLEIIMPQYQTQIENDLNKEKEKYDKPFLIPSLILENAEVHIINKLDTKWNVERAKGVKDSKSELHRQIVMDTWIQHIEPALREVWKQEKHKNDPCFLADAKLEYLTYFLGQIYRPAEDGQLPIAAIKSIAEDNLKFANKRKKYWEDFGNGKNPENEILLDDRFSAVNPDSVDDIISNYESAISYLEVLLMTPEDDTQHWKNLKAGFLSSTTNLSYLIPFIGALFELVDLQELAVSANTYKDGYTLPAHERVRLEAYAGMSEVLSRNSSFMHGLGSMLPGTISFMIEFGLTFGYFSAVKTAATKATQRIIASSVKKSITRSIARNILRASRIVGFNAAVLANTSTFFLPKVFKNAAGHQMPVMIVVTEDGELGFVNGNKKVGDLEAFMHGYFDTWTEVWSEHLGAWIATLPKSVLFKVINKYPKLGDSIVLKWMAGKEIVPKNYYTRSFKTILEGVDTTRGIFNKISPVTGFDGIPIEYLEEFIASRASQVYYGENPLNISGEQELNTLAYVAIVGAILQSGSTIISRNANVNQGSLTLIRSKDGKPAESQVNVSSMLLFRLELLARTQPFSIDAAMNEIESYRRENRGVIEYTENNVVKSETEIIGSSFTNLEKTLLDFYIQSSPEIELNNFILKHYKEDFVTASALTNLNRVRKMDIEEMISLSKVKGYELVSKTLEEAYRSDVNPEVILHMQKILGGNNEQAVRDHNATILFNGIKIFETHLSISEIDRMLRQDQEELNGIYQQEGVRSFVQAEEFEDYRPYQAVLRAKEGKILVSKFGLSEGTIIEENAHILLLQGYRFHPDLFTKYYEILKDTNAFKEKMRDTLYRTAAEESGNPDLYYTLETMAEAISTRGQSVPEIAPSIIQQVIFELRKIFKLILSKVGIQESRLPQSPELLTINELLDILYEESINNPNNAALQEQIDFWSGNSTKLNTTSIMGGVEAKAEAFDATFYRKSTAEQAEQAQLLSDIQGMVSSNLLTSENYSVIEHKVTSRSQRLINGKKRSMPQLTLEELRWLKDTLPQLNAESLSLFTNNQLSSNSSHLWDFVQTVRTREAKGQEVSEAIKEENDQRAHKRFMPFFLKYELNESGEEVEKEISLEEALLMQKEAKKIYFKYSDGRQRFEVQFDAEGNFPVKVIGKFLNLHDFGRGVTQDPEGKITKALMDAAHIIANMFGGSGYRDSGNVIATSAEYNQKLMLRQEDAIKSFIIRQQEIAKENGTEISYFNLEIDVEYTGMFPTAAELSNALHDLAYTDPEGIKPDDPRRKAIGNMEMLEQMIANSKELLKQTMQRRVKDVSYNVTLFSKDGQPVTDNHFEVEEPDYLFGIKPLQ